MTGPIVATDFDNAVSLMWSNNVSVASPIAAGSVFHVQNATFSVWGNGNRFATAPTPGPRHLRYGFKRAISVGSVIVVGDVTPSVLKPDAVYPGDIADDSQWITAERLSGATVNPSASPHPFDVTVWTFPTEVSMRAIRFTKVGKDSDALPGGRLGGVYFIANRFSNVAPQAQIVDSVNSTKVSALNNYRWDARWDNGASGAANTITPENPERLIFTWPVEVTIAGLAFYQNGIGDGLIQRFIGAADVIPEEASESAWETVGTFTGLKFSTGLQVVDLNGSASARAFRIVIQKAVDPAVDAGIGTQTSQGKKVFTTEVMALYSLGANPITASIVTQPCVLPAPIAIPFTLEKAGYVTLVIEDLQGKRVRNLVAETYFSAGDQVAYWDGLDESGRNQEGLDGEYRVLGALVASGNYRARGLVRDQLDLRYEFTVGSAGAPPWRTADSAGGWLSDHRPPSDIVFLPSRSQMMVVSEVAEAGQHGLFLDLNGIKKSHVGPIEEAFYNASHVVVDGGPQAAPNVLVYSAVLSRSRLYIHQLATNQVYTRLVARNHSPSNFIGGLAAWNKILYLSIPASNVIHAIDAANGSFLAAMSVPQPRGMAFDAQGKLVVISGDSLLRFTVSTNPFSLNAQETIVAGGLLDPQRVMVNSAAQQFFVSEWADSNQIKVFDESGAIIRTIGVPGPIGVGLYNRLHMNRPNGMALAPDGRLWVAEYDMAPKRISIWNTDGTLFNAFYGPPKYGGGGRLDSKDKTRFYYADRDPDDPIPFSVGMEWSLNWETGASELKSVYSRYGTNVSDQFIPAFPPETAVYLNGRQYMINTFNAADVSGSSRPVGIWEMVGNEAKLIAAFGNNGGWPILAQAPFTNALPTKPNPVGAYHFIWSDLNGDRQAEPEEVSYILNPSFDSFQIATNLNLTTGTGYSIPLAGFSPSGAPIYNLQARTNVKDNASVVSPELIEGDEGWFVATGGPIRGFREGQVKWTYPSQWPSLHSSQRAPSSTVPRPPGLMIGTTRVLGAPFRPAGEAGMVWAINGNLGDIYLMTMDGLFVSTLFHDIREAPTWSMSVLARDALINDLTLNDEHFWPSITQTADGNVYLVVGKNHSGVVKLSGLESVKRIPAVDFSVTPEQLAACVAYQQELELCKTPVSDRMLVLLSSTAPIVDGNLSDWASTNFVQIDGKATGSVMIANGKLFAAWNTESANLATNTGLQPDALFKTGGALDLMIGSDASASPTRPAAVLGDMRLLVTKVGAATRALLYKAVSAKPNANPVTFTSPVRVVTIQDIEDVTAQVQMAGVGGRYEISIPLEALGFEPANNTTIKADIGVLRGFGGATIQRSYWHNKATVIVSDTPTEAELTPRLWGRWEFRGTASLVVTNDAVLRPGSIGSPYNFSFGATGGSGTVTWTLSSGALPSGLALNSSGLLSGSPTAAGTFNFVVRAADAAGASGSKVFSVIIAPQLTITSVPLLPVATQNSVFNPFAFGASGGNPPYEWSLAAGPLPQGLSVSTGGVLSGTPTLSGLFPFRLRVTDSQAATSEKSFSLAVSPGTTAREAWRLQVFGANANQPIAADGADPDGDGLVNIVEYVLGLDPQAPSDNQRPKPEIRRIDGKDYLTIAYTRATAANDAFVVIESAGEFGSWTANIVEVSRTGVGTENVVVRDTIPLDQSAVRYLRLNVVK